MPNDLILNYNLEMEREVVNVPGKLIVSGIMDAFVGTLYDAMGAGFSLRMGRVRSPYDAPSEASNGGRKYQLYLLMRPTARVIYYNALLQGGIIHHITASEERLHPWQGPAGTDQCLHRSRGGVRTAETFHQACPEDAHSAFPGWKCTGIWQRDRGLQPVNPETSDQRWT